MKLVKFENGKYGIQKGLLFKQYLKSYESAFSDWTRKKSEFAYFDTKESAIKMLKEKRLRIVHRKKI